MTIWISRKLPLLNFERRDILCSIIGHPCENLWPLEFLDGTRCSISSVSIYYVPESYIWVKSYDHLYLSTSSVVQFRASQYIMRLNRTSVWKVMTIWISRELPLLNFERLDILCSLIGHPCEKLWLLEFLKGIRCSISRVSIYYVPESYIRVKSYDHLNLSTGSIVQFRASQYIMHLNRASAWKVMTIWISRELPLLNFERLNILCSLIGHPCEMLCPLEFLDRYRYSISSVSLYYAPKSDICVKIYDHLNVSRGSFVQFRTSRYIKSLTRTFVWIVMTI